MGIKILSVYVRYNNNQHNIITPQLVPGALASRNTQCALRTINIRYLQLGRNPRGRDYTVCMRTGSRKWYWLGSMDNIIVSSYNNNNITIGKYKTNAVRAAALTEYSVHRDRESNAGLIVVTSYHLLLRFR